MMIRSGRSFFTRLTSLAREASSKATDGGFDGFTRHKSLMDGSRSFSSSLSGYCQVCSPSASMVLAWM